MKFRHCLFVFIVMLLSFTAMAQQKSDSSVAAVNALSPSSAVPADPPKDESAVGQSKTGSSLRPFTMFGMGGRASTLGMGVQFGTNLTPRSNLRVGFSSLSWWNFDHSGISYSSNSSLKSVDVLYDYFLVNRFRISPGVLLYFGDLLNAKASVAGGKTFDLGGVTYTSDPANPLKGTGKLTTNKVAPVLLFGYGNLVPRSKHFSVSFDVGVAYHGAPKGGLDLTGNVCQLGVCQSVQAASVQSNVQAEVRKLEHQAAPFKFWPVVSISVGYRFGGAR
jgi:hypothetical protein